MKEPKSISSIYADLTSKARTTFFKKNRAYGDSWLRTEEITGVPVEHGILVRMGDKMARIQNLLHSKDVDDLGESIVDTLIDLANYSLMLASYIIYKKGGADGKNHS